MSNKLSFASKIAEELSARGWTQADLAKSSGLTSAVISRTINSESYPSPETMVSIAKGFGLPATEVFRWAGLLPPETERDRRIDRLEHLIGLLPEEDQQDIIRYAEFLYEKKRNKGNLQNGNTSPQTLDAS